MTKQEKIVTRLTERVTHYTIMLEKAEKDLEELEKSTTDVTTLEMYRERVNSIKIKRFECSNILEMVAE